MFQGKRLPVKTLVGVLALALTACGGTAASGSGGEAVGSSSSALLVNPQSSDTFFNDATGDVKVVVRTCSWPDNFTTGSRCAYCALDYGWTVVGGGAEIQLQNQSSTDARLRGSLPYPNTLNPVGAGTVSVESPDGSDTNCTGNSNVSNDINAVYTAWLARSGGGSSHKLRAYVIGLQVAGLSGPELGVTYNDFGNTSYDPDHVTQSKLQVAQTSQARGLLIGGGADSVASNLTNYLTENRYDAATQTWKAVGYDPNRRAAIKTYAIGIDLQALPAGWTSGLQASIKSFATGPATGIGKAAAQTSYPYVLASIGAQGVSNDPNSRYLTGLVPFSGSAQGATVSTKDQGTAVSGTTTGYAVTLLGGRPAARSVNSWSQLNYRYGTNPLPGAVPQLDHNGNLLLLKEVDSLGTNLVKLDADRNTVWSVPVQPVDFTGIAMQLLNFGTHIAVDNSNNVYVNSFFDNRTTNADVCVNKFNANGTLAWRKVYSIGAVNTSEHEQPGPMAIGSDGSLYVVGHTGQSITTAQPTVLLRIDPATGSERNRRNLTASSDFTTGMGNSVLATDSSGNVYYGGPQGLFSFSQDVQTQRWSRTLMPRALAVDSSNGALFVTGVGSAGSQQYNMFVSRLASATGATVWNWASSNETLGFTYNSVLAGGDDRSVGGNQILRDSTGQIYAAGHGILGNNNGGLVAKFDQASGANLWWQPYGFTDSGASVFALGVDNLNQIYAAGSRWPEFFSKLEVLSPVNGSEVWSAQGWNLAFTTGTSQFEREETNSVTIDGNGSSYWNQFVSTDDGGDNDNLYQFRGSAVPDGTYVIVGQNSGMALDDPASSTATGKQMDQWTVNNGSNQKWTVTNLGNNTLRLVNQASGLSLGVRAASGSNGAAVEQNTWTGANSQRWVVSASGTQGYFILKNVNSGQALDVAGASKTAGALIDQWPSSGGTNQLWHFQ